MIPQPWRLLAVWAVLVLLGTLHPFAVEPGPVLLPSDTFWQPRFKGLDPPFNVLMFMPVGWALGARGRGLGAALGLGLAFSGLIELSQHFICFRVPVAEDLAFNTVGAGLGHRLGPWLTRTAARLDGPWPRKLAFVVVSAFVIWSAAPPRVTAELWMWAERAELIVGRERPGNYRWPGEVRGARYWVGTSTAGAPDWDLARDGEGVFEALVRRSEAAQAFVLQVDLRGAAPPEGLDGPARILVWSGGVQRRNLMLAQDGARLLFRVRTRVTPIVGRFPDRTEPLVLPAPGVGEATRVTVRYDHGQLEGEAGAQVVQGKLTSLHPHNGVRRFWLPNEPWGGWIYAFSAGLVGAFALAGVVSRRRAAVAGLGLYLVTEGLQVAAFGLTPDLVALLFAGLGVWLATQSAPRSLAA